MTRGQALAQLIRMRDMKTQRLSRYRGRSDSFLRADIAALNYAIETIDALRAAEGGVAAEVTAGGGPSVNRTTPPTQED